jgi:ribosomally synthesized peptide (two-chain TOMM family)
MSTDGMMTFRTSYLRAIAWAWEQPEHYHRMVHSDAEELFDYLGLPFPAWDIKISLQPPRAAHEPVCEAGDGYQPAFAGRWVGPKPILKLPFPDAPTVEPVAALAAFYELLPTPFGPKTSGGEAGPGGMGMGPVSDALVLGAVLMRAVAMHWNTADGKLHEAYEHDLFGPRGGKPPRNINDALAKWQGYDCPWNMELVAMRCDSTWDGTGWSKRPRAELTLFVPAAPTETSLPFALAAYNQTGAAYPLTCP